MTVIGDRQDRLDRGPEIVAISVLVQLATVAIPGLRTVLGLTPLDSTAYALIIGALVISVLGASLSAHVTREHPPAKAAF